MHTALPETADRGPRAHRAPGRCRAHTSRKIPVRPPQCCPRAVRATSTVGLASGPPGGRRAASTLDRATRTVCHTAGGLRQSSRRDYPWSDVGQTGVGPAARRVTPGGGDAGVVIATRSTPSTVGARRATLPSAALPARSTGGACLRRCPRERPAQALEMRPRPCQHLSHGVPGQRPGRPVPSVPRHGDVTVMAASPSSQASLAWRTSFFAPVPGTPMSWYESVTCRRSPALCSSARQAPTGFSPVRWRVPLRNVRPPGRPGPCSSRRRHGGSASAGRSWPSGRC